MIILSDWDRIGDSYRMVLKMSINDSIDDLPSANKPMSPEFFAVSKEYGIPADGSVVIINNGDTLIYKGGEWAPAFLPMPVKGDLITLDGKQYRVLKVNDTVAEVLAMYDSSDLQCFNNDKDAGNIYENSALDNYLSQTFYNSLNTSIQNAIVAKTFQQDSWKPNGGSSAIANYAAVSKVKNTTYTETFSLMSPTYASSISRKCYLLSCQDVIDYVEATTSMGFTDTTLTSENVQKMFWNQITSIRQFLWLRSAYPVADKAIGVLCKECMFPVLSVTELCAVRPVFQVDLSKVEWALA